jgi:anthranilate/para-aminobenzoate synthase component I
VSAIEVQSQARELPFLAPLPALLQLQQAWGERGVVLLESLFGPARDMQSSLIGFGPVLSLSVRGTTLALQGMEPVVAAVAGRLRGAQLVADDGAAFRMRSEGALWDVLRTIAGAFACQPNGGAAFQFGFVGYLGYDVVRSIERLPYRITAGDDQPTLVLTLFQGFVTFDLVHRRTSLLLHGAPGFWNAPSADEIVARLAAAERPDAAAEADPVPAVPVARKVRRTIRRPEYLDNVARALEYIRSGDIYQVQLGHELEIETSAPPIDIYRRLRFRNPSPYMYIMPAGDATLVGASPESFIKIEAGQIAMRPIAGTARRGKTPAEDAALVQKLSTDEKELAEHIMLVDLCRNDIGRVCLPGTLETSDLLVVEQYSHVNHLVSNVTGTLRSGLDAFDAIAATFPAGTMTGAPKIRAMEIIEELETKRRGAYAGAVGVIDFSGYVNMALCIRSTVHRNGCYALRASAGTVADSIAENEWRETLHKMGANYWAVTGEELTGEGLFD